MFASKPTSNICWKCSLVLWPPINLARRHHRRYSGFGKRRTAAKNEPRRAVQSIPAKHARDPTADIISDILPKVPNTNTSIPPSPVSATSAPTPSPPEEEDRIAKARIVFGSRLAGPAQRRRELDAASREIAGILVPPRPTEPDNCCMSGCVNCVWDRYQEDMEEWSAKTAEARAALAAQNAAQPATQQPATSMDDDGGGSEANWISPAGGDVFEDIPVGIREFMKTEKRLRQLKSVHP